MATDESVHTEVDLQKIEILTKNVELGERSWDDYKAQAEAGTHRVVAELIPNVEGPDDAVNIRFTSGTTGLPKGSTLSHLNILNNGYFVGRAMQLTEPGIR